MRQLSKGVAAALLSVTALASAASAENLVFMSGPAGGSWYPLAGAMKSVIEAHASDLRVQVRPGAGLVNLKGVQEGKAHLGFGMVLSSVDAINGVEPFERNYDEVCHIAALNQNYMQNTTTDRSVETLDDIKGKSLTTVPAGTTTEMATRHALQSVGLNYGDMSKVNHASLTDSVNMMKDGHVDVFMTITSVPNGTMIDLTNSANVRFIPITDEQLAKMKEVNAGWERLMIPAGAYPGVEEDVPTVGFPAHIFGSCTGMSEETAYKVTKALVENVKDLAHVVKELENFTAKDMGRELGMPFHPGAEKYYKEVGVM